MTEETIQARVARCLPSLPASAQRVARYIVLQPAQVLASSAMGLADATGTSDATVVRSVQALGFAGLGALKQALAQELAATAQAAAEAPTPAVAMRRTLAQLGPEATQAAELVLRSHAMSLASLRRPATRQRLAAAVQALHPAARILVYGIGPSAPLAAYVSAMLRRIGRATAPLDRTGAMLADQLLDMRAGDGLLALAYGRAYPEITATLAEAARLGLPVVLVSDEPDGPLAALAQVVLPACRGRAGQVALHAATLAVTEALVLGLAAVAPQAAVSTLDELGRLRAAVAAPPG